MHTKWNAKSWQQWFWGLFCLAGAVVLVGSQLGWFAVNIGFWPLLWTLILVAVLISGLAQFNLTEVVFSLAFLAIIYAAPLGITRLVPWTILGAALLLSIGLALLVRPFRRHHHAHHGVIVINDKTYSLSDWHKANKAAKASYQTDDSPTDFSVNLRMGSTVRYVNTDNFRHARIQVKLGDVKVYFDKAQIATEPALIELMGQVGDIDLYVPKEWNLQPQLQGVAVDYSEKGETPVKSGPQVILTGSFHVGDVTIHYI